MTVPETIPIRRDAGYHLEKMGLFAYTDEYGSYAGGYQFLGATFFLKPNQQQLISVLHRFTPTGAHFDSVAWDSSDGTAVEQELDRAIQNLTNAQLADIRIRPFSAQLLRKIFGLIKVADDRLDYVPFGLAFFPPWDGFYDT